MHQPEALLPFKIRKYARTGFLFLSPFSRLRAFVACKFFSRHGHKQQNKL
jgi:hypothetical protein